MEDQVGIVVAILAFGCFSYVVGRIHQIIDDNPHKFWYSQYEEVSAPNRSLRRQLRLKIGLGYRDPAPLKED